MSGKNSLSISGVNTSPTGLFPTQPTTTPPANWRSALHTLRSPRNQRSVSRTPRQHINGAKPSPPTSSGRARAMSICDRKAALSIDFIIVGGGITGISTAFALAQGGHRVRVFEQLDRIHQRGVGVRIPPNLSKIFYEWGLHTELSKASRCLKSTFLSLETNEPVGILEWKEDVIKETGGDFLLMHYDDIYGLLYNLAISQGVKFQFNTRIKTVYFDEEQQLPVVQLIDGTVHSADLVIGADGYNSIVRDVVTAAPDPAVDSGRSFFSIVVPAEKIKDDPDWSQWLNVSEWPIWMGDTRNILGYPIREGKEFCVHAYYPDKCIQTSDFSESWTTVAPTSLIDFEDAHPSIKRIFDMVPDAIRVKYMLREMVEDWVDDSGTIMLIGESAHSLMPCTIHNLSLAVEDAAVLGVLMSHLRTRAQIPQLLEAFQDLRFGRVQQVQQSELSNAALTVLPPGEYRDMRNAALGPSLLRESAGEWDDAQLREQWEEISGAFGYNALEAAEDWWIKWGSIGDTAQGFTSSQPFDIIFEITKVAFSSNTPPL